MDNVNIQTAEGLREEPEIDFRELMKGSRHYQLAALQAAGVGSWSTDLETGRTFWDERARQIFGVTSDVAITVEKGISIIHPEDRERTRRALEAATRPGASGRYDVEKRVVWKDGTVRWVETRGQVQFEGDGEQRRATRISGIVIDVTERKQLEEALREKEETLRVALKHIPVVVWQQDEQLRYRWIYNSQLGYRNELVVGRRNIDLLERREEAKRIDAVKLEVLDSGVGRRVEVPVTREGRTFYYDLTIEPLWEDGRVAGITCAAYDVTLHREAEAEREQMLAELAALNETLEEQVEIRTKEVVALSRSLAEAEQKERRRLGQVLHDDLQQMLVALQIQLAMMADVAPPAFRTELREKEEFVGEIAEATRSLSLELSTPVLESESVAEIFAWLAEVMQARYRLRVTMRADGSCNIANRDMRELLFRTVQELLFNVVKHARVDEARLELTNCQEEVTVLVVDNGSGFDVQSALEASKQRASLGLFRARERLQQFGGQFEIASTPGAGTQIRVTMPKS